MSKRATLIWLVLIIGLGIGLRSYELTARSLWFDEAFSWRLIQFPLPEMIARDATDVHPPLYYLILKGWSIVFGSSLLALRSFSVTAAGLSIAAAYLFASSAFKSRPAGLLAATLLALAGWQIQFAWEARMYTLGTVLVLLSSWALLMAVREEPQRLSRWVLYALLGSAVAYVHYYALFTIAAHLIFVIGYLGVATGGRVGELLQARRLWYAVIALVMATVVYMPWLPVALRQNSQVQASYWVPSIGGWSIPDTFYRMFIPTATIPQHVGLGWISLALVPLLGTALLLFALVRYRSRRENTPDAQWLVWLLAVVPFVLSIIISFISQSLYQDRFFVFAHVFILMALAFVLIRVPWPMLRRGLIVLVILGFIGADIRYWRELDIVHKPGVHAATQFMYGHHQAGEPILVSSPFIYFAVLHYATEEQHAAELPHLYSETGQLEHFAGGPILKADDIVDSAIFTTDSPVVWVADTTGFGSQPLAVPQSWRADITETYPEVFSHQGTVTVTRYVK